MKKSNKPNFPQVEPDSGDSSASLEAKFIENGASRVTEKDIEKVVHHTEEIKKKFTPKGTLNRFVEDSQLMLGIVKDYWQGKYRRIPFMMIGAIVFSLLYVLNPWDIMPDVLPIVGQLDDATVVSVCLYLVDQELRNYKNWKKGS